MPTSIEIQKITKELNIEFENYKETILNSIFHQKFNEIQHIKNMSEIPKKTGGWFKVPKNQNVYVCKLFFGEIIIYYGIYEKYNKLSKYNALFIVNNNNKFIKLGNGYNYFRWGGWSGLIRAWLRELWLRENKKITEEEIKKDKIKRFDKLFFNDLREKNRYLYGEKPEDIEPLSYENVKANYLNDETFEYYKNILLNVKNQNLC